MDCWKLAMEANLDIEDISYWQSIDGLENEKKMNE
jgi:hypothetical protein